VSESPKLSRRVDLAYRIVQVCLLLSLVWKYEFFYQSIQVYAHTPIEDDFFPGVLRANQVLVGSFAVAVVATSVSILIRWVWVRHLAGAVALCSLSVLCLHQGSYNDATFTTAWWTSLWSCWFVSRMNRDEADVLVRKAAFLGRCIISMILIGGAVGKWTPEYWSGEVLHDIYFIDRQFWTFNWLREHYDEASLREIATMYSRFVIVVETGIGLTLWMMPPRTAAVIAIILLTSMGLFSNFLLFSVLLSLIGMAVVGLFVGRHSLRPTRKPKIL
jgi:hypothetical protein